MVINLLQADTMKFSILARCLHPMACINRIDPDIKGIVYDSRQVRPGSCYVALPGTVHDGSDFIDQAIASGALAIISERAPDRRDVAWAQVEDARQALSEAAACFYGFPSGRLSLTGVTGTNGKTTTACMLHHIEESAQRTTGLVGTIEYRIGTRTIPATRTTPEAPDLHAMLDQMLKSGCSHAVMEVSSHSIDQKRGSHLDFDRLVFTNLSQDHLDYHGSMEAYYLTKQSLFDDMLIHRGHDVAMIISVEDEWGKRLHRHLAEADARLLSVGLSSDADIYAENVQYLGFECRARIHTPQGSADLSLPMVGRHNLMNALCAVAAAIEDGISPGEAVAALRSMPGVPGRLEHLTRDGIDIFIDYAHTPDALDQVLDILSRQSGGRLISVFGCGGDRDRGKRALMGHVSSDRADLTVLTADNPRSEDPNEIMREIRLGMKDGHPCVMIPDRFDAIRHALGEAAAGDVVLLAGKGHETTQEIGSTIVPFSDRECVHALLDGATE
jgi:UDP-N-acetylmuramoyl-L-alanyl-D-glutamate--2,6-diaminopimelate ligase